MATSAATGFMPTSGKLKVFLLILAFLIVAGTLAYTHDIVLLLEKKEMKVADLYAKSIQYIANARAGEGDYNFVFNEVVSAIDFPIVETDPGGSHVNAFRNVEVDSSAGPDRLQRFFRDLIARLDEKHSPIVVAYQDTIVLSLVHYGESPLITRLRWLPYVELAIAALFVLIGYISFSYVKRSEQSNIWVGMARETAHQLGTPISSMLGWTELLKEQSADDPKAQETLRDMEHDLHRLQKIADRFSKIGSKPDLRDEPLFDVIRNVVAYFERRIPHTGKKVELILDQGADIHASINRELFEWVVENLTKNALDAIENGVGTIRYAVSEHGKHVFIDVTDSGKGIDLKHRNEVFRPGFSTKKRGWGLGLSLSKRIVETYHRGKLFVKDTRPGVGTTFRIRLSK